MRKKVVLHALVVFVVVTFIIYIVYEQLLKNSSTEDTKKHSADDAEIKAIREGLKKRTYKSIEEIHNKIWKDIEMLQEEGDCESKKIVHCENMGNYAGLGSMVHRYGVCIQTAYGLGRMFFIHAIQYEHFGGLSHWLKPESEKCGYMKYKYSRDSKDICNMHDPKCYLENGYDIDNSPKVLQFTAETKSPAPRRVAGTIPKDIEEALLHFNVTDPWLWFTSQFLGYLMLRINENFQQTLNTITQELHYKYPLVSMHIRRGDKIVSSEAHLVAETLYVEEADKYFNNAVIGSKRTIFLASDWNNMTARIRGLIPTSYQLLTIPDRYKDMNWYWTPGEKLPVKALESMFIDLFLLMRANFTVCTFTSNICRLVYELRLSYTPYLAVSSVKSIDAPNMFYNYWSYGSDLFHILWVTLNENTEEKVIHRYHILKYQPGTLFRIREEKFSFHVGGQSYVLMHVETVYRPGEMLSGYIYADDVMEWPGHPSYYFEE